MSEDWEFICNDAEAETNFKFGESSAKVKYRSDTGAVPSLNLCNVGAKASYETVRAEKPYGDGLGKLSAHGPSTGVDVGLQINHERIGVNAMAEASIAKAKATMGPVFAEANLNANTGAKVGTDGVKFGFLGLGATLGVGGRWSIDTPVGSLGGGGGGGGGGEGNTDTNKIPQKQTYSPRKKEERYAYN